MEFFQIREDGFMVAVNNNTKQYNTKENAFGLKSKMSSTFTKTETYNNNTKRNFRRDLSINKEAFQKLKLKYLIKLKADLVNKKKARQEVRNTYQQIDKLEKVIVKLENDIEEKNKEKDDLINKLNGFEISEDKKKTANRSFEFSQKLQNYNKYNPIPQKEDLKIFDSYEMNGWFKRDLLRNKKFPFLY